MHTLISFDPSATPTGTFDTEFGVQASEAQIYVWNDSNVALAFQLQPGRVLMIPPGVGYPIRKRPFPIPAITWSQSYSLTGATAAISRTTVEHYEPGEPLPSEVPIPIIRNVNVGNQVNTTGSNALKNDGNAPGTSIIEATPSDQASSAIAINNDGSSVWKILSANVQRIFLNLVRGNTGVGKAAIQLGDSGDPTILVVYGAIQGGQDANIGNVTCKTISFGDLFFSTQSQIFFSSANPYVAYATPLAGGSALGHLFETWNGTASKLPFSIGGRFAGASAWVDNAGVINVPGGQALGTKSNGGGASGATVWVGTTDPGANAAEGDLWVAI